MIQFLRGLLRTLIWFAVGLLCAFLFATGFSFTQLTTIATSPNHRGSPNTYTSDGKLTGRFVNKVSQSKVPKNKVPKVIVISLDGATPRLVNQYLTDGVLSQSQGIGLLQSQGVAAQQNITITPSLTAPAHIAIGTGSTAANNDINANSFHLVASPFNQNISGFAAPIGGYEFDIHELVVSC